MNPNLEPRRVIRNVCRLCQVKQKDLLSKRRPAPLAWARQVTMFMLGRICDLNDRQVAKLFPLHTYGAVQYARECVRDAMGAYPEIQRDLEQMEAVLAHPPFKTIRPEPSQTSPTSREP